MQQEHKADQCNDQAFLDQRMLEGVDGAVDQVGAVIDRFDTDALAAGSARVSARRSLTLLNDRERILAEALQRDAGDDLALSVQFGDAAPFIRRQLHPRNVFQENRYTAIGS